MMPGLVIKHTNNNVAILECITSMPEQGIINNKLETMEIQQTTERETKTDEKLETVTNENEEISNTQIEENCVDNTEKLENRVPENNSTEVSENTEELSTTNCKQNENKAEELPDTMDVPKYPDKEPPEKIIKQSSLSAPIAITTTTTTTTTTTAGENCSENIKQNSISVNNVGEPSTSKINFRKQNKLKTFLNKYNVTENELMLKLKSMKRLTKDKIKLDSVLSHKLNRNYLKILKRRRSIKSNLNNSATSSAVADDEDSSSGEYSTCESEDSGRENTTIEATTGNTPVEGEIEENAHIEKKNHDIHSEALIESKLEETTAEVVSNNSEITENGLEESLEHENEDSALPEVATPSQTNIEKQICSTEENLEDLNSLENITTEQNCLLENKEENNDEEVTNKTPDTTSINTDETNDKKQNLLENTQNEVSSEIGKISGEIEDTETSENTQDKEIEVPSDADKTIAKLDPAEENVQTLLEIEETKANSEINKTINDSSKIQDVEEQSFSKNEEDDYVETEICENSEKLIIDLDTTEEIDFEHNLLENNEEDVETSEFSKNSNDLVIDLDTTEESIDNEENLSENIGTNENEDIKKRSDNSLEIDNKQNAEETNGITTIKDTPANHSPEDEEIKCLAIDENKTSAFMILLESLEIVTGVVDSIENKQKKSKVVGEDQDKSVNVREEENPVKINKFLSTIEEEPNFEAQTIEECIDSSEEQCIEEEVKSISENSRSSNKDCEIKLGEPSPLTVMPNLFEDEDIRNKIKLQLELLRRNSRKSVEPIIENEEESVHHEVIEMDETTCLPVEETPTVAETKNEKIQTPKVNTGIDLSDVLISNEGELAIINVVGGYVSENEDEEKEDVIVEVLKPEGDEPTLKNASKKIKRGISITDRLLMNFSQENSHIIKPTKTTDITKIKGWRSKTFNVTNEEDVKSNVEAATEEIHIEEEVPPLIYFKTKETNSSLENPLPGTSSTSSSSGSGSVIQQREISKTSEAPQEVTKLPEEENKKSAFVSDYLETFLSTNSELKISYEVPKLVAEESISKADEMPAADFPLLQPVTENNTTTSYKPKQNSIKKAKPKTLAEKRRMLELDRKNELLHDMETNEQIYLKRLEYCEKRNKTEIANDIRNNLVANLVPFSRLCWKLATKEHRQFAICKGEKILLSGSAGGEDIIVPNTKLNKFKTTRDDDDDDDDDDDNDDNVPSANSGFRPGPLSKKPKLITQDNFECHVLKMPKIKLEVYPEQNKPLPIIAQQYLQLCRHDQFVVNKNWADFAVTAVQTREKPSVPPNKFEFDIPYANGRNKILVRIPIRKLSPVKYPERTYSNRFPEINVEENIKDIVSDLLTCVENRELDTKIIKNDPDLTGLFINMEKDVDRPLSPIDPRVQAIIKRPNAKRNKTTLELRRLNVQVIEVDVKEDESIPENCLKEFCKFGCVCKSLRGACALIPEHCGREECMLQCNCSFEALQKGRHQITLPPGTDLLSASTVVRLQDEAKRNLAKVEREFTQTVIKANNQTIMVGGGARERTRRVPKVPKKYSNFAVDKPNPKGVSNYDKMMSEGITIEEEYLENEVEKSPPKKKPEIEEPDDVLVETKKPVPIWINKDKEKQGKRSSRAGGACRVVLNKMKLDHIIPWCMVHNLYKCYCGGKATFQENVEPIKPMQTPVEDTEYISYNPRFGAARHPDTTTPHTVTDFTEKYCARTKALPTNYYHARNKSQRFKADYAVMKQIEEKNTHFDNISNNFTRNKRKSLDTYETYSNEDISFNNQDLLVPIKKKSSYIKKRDVAQSILLPQKKRSSEAEEAENQAKRQKSYEEEEEDSLESLSLLDRLNESHNVNMTTVKSYQKVPIDKIAKMVVRKTKKQKPKVIMRDPDKLPSLLVKSAPKVGPESLQLTSEDLVETKLSPSEQKKRLENTHIVSSTAFIDYERSYMGLLIPSREWLGRFHKMLNPNDHTIVHQIRLLEWATMVKRQECNALQVWFNTKKYNNIILTEDRRRPSSGHVNVKTFKSYTLQNFKIPDIVSSLLANKLPGAAEKATETYLILVFNGINWEARGTIVLSGTTEICKKKLALKPAPTSILTPNLSAPWLHLKQNKPPPAVKQYSLESGKGIGTLIIKSTPAMSVEVRNSVEAASPPPVQPMQPIPPKTPKPSNPKISAELEIISLPPSTTTSPIVSDKSDNKDYETSIPVIDRTKYNIGSILAPLPTGGDLHRWFMLILENDFSVLRISFSKFHIKYTHLQTAINMAKKSQKTVRIKTPPANCPEVSENFSIYACPESSQRIFFGPYGNRSDHGLETFRYVNGKLVNTKIYNKMRGNPERKTSGYWFTHNSTMNHNLNLEPNFDEGSSGSECATAVTSIENVSKPQIELVDLTGNDSDAEEEIQAPNKEIDPLLNLLSVDLTKKVANDITIEAVPSNPQQTREIPEKVQNINNDIEIEAIYNPTDKAKKHVVERKRKPDQDVSEEPVAKHPTLIDSIELDDDDEMPILEPYNKDQNEKKSPNPKMPPLRPINTNSSKDKDKGKPKNKNNCLYVITNIPGVGYFEIFFEKTKTNRQSMYTQIKGSKTTFQTINNAIKYLHYLCTKCIYFMPKTLKVKFSIVDSAEPPEMPKFKDEFLNGYHMISERGIFNILNINTKDLDNLGFDEEEIQKLLSYKCDLLIARNIKQLGTFLFGHEAAKKMPQEEILRMAPGKIKLMEQQETNLMEEKNVMNIRQQNLLALLNDLQRNIPEALRSMTKQKIANILGEKAPIGDCNETAVTSLPIPEVPRTLLNSQKLDTPAVVKPILNSKMESSKFTVLGNSAIITKTMNPLPVGKFCRIVDGKLIVLDQNSATKPSASAAPRLQVVPNIQPTMNILSPQQFQNLINPNPNDKNSKFELLVPITGLQSPATVVTFGQNVQNATTIVPTNSSTLLVANSQPKVVDLTDD